jgi:hypothetical protein
MLSPKNLFRTILSLVLTIVFSLSSNELRIATSTMVAWALGLIAHHHLSLSATFLRCHLFILLPWWLLAATNDLFYESTVGLLPDVFFPRPSYDSETPGSGFMD